MRCRAPVSIAVCALAAGITVAGCASASSSSPPGHVPATAPSTQAGSSPPASQQAQAGGSGGTCEPGGLSFALGATTGNPGQQTTQPVDLTNTGSSACTMDGFPGVDLVGVADGQQDYTWSLVRSSAIYSGVTLQPGQTAHFDLLYLPGNADSSDITVSKMVITPPNDFTQAELTWNQDVLLQDGATHPGTYITPIVSGP
jgi:hypothetical protein